jgi:hypothetical protein
MLSDLRLRFRALFRRRVPGTELEKGLRFYSPTSRGRPRIRRLLSALGVSPLPGRVREKQ